MTLHAPYDPDNIFAKILRGEMPCAKITETDHAIAIMDAFPQTRGHCLVIPKAPSRNLLEVAPKDIGRVYGLVQRIAKAVDKALSPDGIITLNYNGAPAGQTVFHTHIHVIPRYEGEAMAGHGSAGMADPAELKALAEHIAAALPE